VRVRATGRAQREIARAALWNRPEAVIFLLRRVAEADGVRTDGKLTYGVARSGCDCALGCD